jgi:hypothetical protein
MIGAVFFLPQIQPTMANFLLRIGGGHFSLSLPALFLSRELDELRLRLSNEIH